MKRIQCAMLALVMTVLSLSIVTSAPANEVAASETINEGWTGFQLPGELLYDDRTGFDNKNRSPWFYVDGVCEFATEEEAKAVFDKIELVDNTDGMLSYDLDIVHWFDEDDAPWSISLYYWLNDGIVEGDLGAHYTVKKSKGSFTIKYEDLEWTYNVRVMEHPEAVTLDKSEITVRTGESFELTAIAYPKDAFYEDIQWTGCTPFDDQFVSGMTYVKANENTATFIAWKPGTYEISAYMFWNEGWTTSPTAKSCTVTVIGDEIKEPETLAGATWFDSGVLFGDNDTTNLRLTVYSVSEKVTDMTAEVWCDTNGDADKRTYPLTKGTETWYVKGGIDIAENHKEIGQYHVRLYGIVDGVKTLLNERKYYVYSSKAGFEPEVEFKLPDNTCYMGDADLDGTVTASDALLVLKNVVGLAELSEKAVTLSDMDGNGDITADDALEILKIVVNLSTSRPVIL